MLILIFSLESDIINKNKGKGAFAMELSCVMTRRAKLLSALRRELRISDGLVRRLKPLDAFRVNGESAHTNRLLEPGDRVSVTIEEAAPDFPAEDGPLSILYEDECLLVLDKPAGILVHPSFSRQTGTLANYLLGYYRRTGQACGVHVLTRLDRDTMGVVVFAKNAWAHWLLMEQLADGRLEKVYEALTVGGPEADEGLIDLPIAKRPNPSLLRFVSPEGKPARTRFRVLERGEICRLELRPLTGRTHQLRVHCAYLGFPILGDPQYGKGSGIKDQGAGDGGTGPSAPLRCAQDDKIETVSAVGAVIGRPNEATGNRQQATGEKPACRDGSQPSAATCSDEASKDGGTGPSAPLRCAQDDAGGSGQQLAARRITLEHPLTGERMCFVSEIALGTGRQGQRIGNQ